MRADLVLRVLRIPGKASWLLAVVLASVGACQDATGPPFLEEVALVRLNGNPELDRTHRLLAIGLESRRVLAWSDRIMAMAGTAPAPDGGTVYVVGVGEAGWRESQIAALDTRTLTVRWRELLADSGGYRRDRFDGIAVHATSEVEVSPDGSRLFLASAEKDGFRGVAVLDSRTRDALGFVGSYLNGSMTLTVVPPGPYSRSGALAVSAGESGGWPDITPIITLVDPETLAVIDSVDLSAVLASEEDGVMNMQGTSDGTHLFIRSGAGELIKYSLVDQQVETRVWPGANPCVRCMTLDPVGQRLYLADTWTQESPSSGLIYVYDFNLNELLPIDLSGVEIPQLDSSLTNPPALNSVAVAPDGTVLVASGAMLAQLWGFQSARILFVDPSSYELKGVIEQDGEVAAVEIILP